MLTLRVLTVEDPLGVQEELAASHVQGDPVPQAVPLDAPVAPRYGTGHVAPRHQLCTSTRRRLQRMNFELKSRE